ncbi:MAG: MscL family protein [Candidatus Nanoarchaeia archaeon]
MSLKKELNDFFKDFKIISLAVAFVMGGAVNSIINSLVNNIIMPIIFPSNIDLWESTTLNIGLIQLRIGSFLSSLINFAIIVLVLFLMVKLSTPKES